jgi:predicted short-subunit dehydrogenase-like oxidoreductase (DUF2520 family)
MPLTSFPRLGFIGAGRLARCLALGFARAGYPVTAITSRSTHSASELAAAIDGCRVVGDPQQVVADAEVVFLAVPDDSIGTIANTVRLDSTGQNAAPTKAFVHCSGATSVEVLAPLRSQGAPIGGFHPLFLFSGAAALDVERIAGCSVTIEAEGELKTTLVALAQALGCHPLAIAGGQRMLYHGAAHYAASFALSSLAECVDLWRQLGFDEEQSLRALLPMLEGTIKAARDKGLAEALAGPVSRGDAGLLERQLATFEGLDGDHALLYGLLTRRAVALARRRAKPPVTIDEVDANLEASLARTFARISAAK